MKKTINVLLIALLSISLSHAQSLSQVVVASSGATITGASNTLSFTAGEAVIGTIINGESLGQGFWPGAVLVLGSEDFTFEVQTAVYPNPVVNYLNLYFNEMAGQDFEVRLYDTLGKQVLDKKLLNSSENETLNFSEYSAGIYILTIVESTSNKSKSFKIIKQ
jgi:hypothetical protein